MSAPRKNSSALASETDAGKRLVTYVALPQPLVNSIGMVLPYQDASRMALVNKSFRDASKFYFQRFDFDLALSSQEFYNKLTSDDTAQFQRLQSITETFARQGHKTPTRTPESLSSMCNNMSPQEQVNCLFFYEKLPIAIKRGFFKPLPSFFCQGMNLYPEDTTKLIRRLKDPTPQQIFQFFLSSIKVSNFPSSKEFNIGLQHQRMREAYSVRMSQFRKMIPKNDFNHIVINLLVKQGRNSTVCILVDDWKSLLGKKNSNGKYALQLAIEDPSISQETRDWLFENSPSNVRKVAKNSGLKENLSALEAMEPEPIKCTFAFFDCRSAGSMASVSKDFKDPARYYFRQQMYFRQFHEPIFQDLVRRHPTTKLPSHETNRDLYAALTGKEKIIFIDNLLTRTLVPFKKGYFATPLINDAIRLNLDLAGKIVDKCADDKPTLEMGFHHFLDTLPPVSKVTDADKRLITKFRKNMPFSAKERVLRRKGNQDQYCFITPSKATNFGFGLSPRVENFLFTFLPYEDVACDLAQVNKHFRAASEYYFQRFDFDLALSSRELFIELKHHQQESVGHHFKRVYLHISDIPESFRSKDSKATCDELIKQHGKAINSKFYGNMKSEAKANFLYYRKLPVAIKRDFFQPSFFYNAIHLNPKRTMKAIERGRLNGPTLQRVFQYFLSGIPTDDLSGLLSIGEQACVHEKYSERMSQFRKMIPKADFNHIMIDLLVEQGRGSIVCVLVNNWKSLLGEKNLNGKYALQLAIEDPSISKETRNWLFKESPKAVQKLQNSWLKENAPAPTSRRFG